MKLSVVKKCIAHLNTAGFNWSNARRITTEAVPKIIWRALYLECERKIGRPNDPLSELLEVHEIIKIDPPKGLLISKEYIDLYEKGCSIHEIASITGKSRHWIREILRRHKISSRPKVEESKLTAWRTRPRTHAHPPFGYAYFQGQLIIEAKEHEILLLVERLGKEGENPNSIAGYLNAKGLKPRRAKAWSRNSIVLILKRQIKSD